MSDQDPSTTPAPVPAADEQAWPETCPQCGKRLQQVAVAFAADSPEQVGATADVAEAVFEDRCPDPSCPANQAGAGDGSPSDGSGSTLGDRQPDQPTLPGSLGGDNGGG